MPEAELGQKRVNGACLNAFSTATVSNLSGLDMIHPIRNYKRQRSETFYDLTGCFGAQKTLQ
jgi:hypothetical protein